MTSPINHKRRKQRDESIRIPSNYSKRGKNPTYKVQRLGLGFSGVRFLSQSLSVGPFGQSFENCFMIQFLKIVARDFPQPIAERSIDYFTGLEKICSSSLFVCNFQIFGK